MQSSRRNGKEVDFDISISPGGMVSYEYEAEDEAVIKRLLADERGEPPNSPRVLPRADEILTPEETAKNLGIPRKTVIFLCAEGRLEGAFKAGRRWRIPGRAIRRMAGAL